MKQVKLNGLAKRSLVGASLLAVLGMGMMTSAFAAEGDVVKSNKTDVTIKAPASVGNGGLDLETSAIKSFGQIELGTTPETYKTGFDKALKVTDLRGTQAGYSLSVSASQFQNTDGHKLPVGSITLDGVKSIERVGTGTGTAPLAKLNSTTAIDGGEVLVANAAAGTGAGVFDISFNEDALGLIVDATTAKVGTYESTLTWNLQATPVAE